MSEQESSKTGNGPCSWCCGGSSLNVASGAFRDFDSDFFYGVPVCGGCGGTGVGSSDPDFKQRATEIMDLRFAYCPVTDPAQDPCGPLPSCLLLQRLEALKSAIVNMYEKYGRKSADDKSYAKQVVDGGLDARIERHRRDMEEDVARVRRRLSKAGEEAAPIEAIALALEGKLDEAEACFMSLVGQSPVSSEIQHGVGGFFLAFRRDADKALPYLRKSCELLPSKALHFWQAAQLLTRLDREPEAMALMARARNCPDFDKLPDDLRAAILAQASKN